MNNSKLTTTQITNAMKHPAPLSKRDGKGLSRKLQPKLGSDNGNMPSQGQSGKFGSFLKNS